jgi:hypothetical protein
MRPLRALAALITAMLLGLTLALVSPAGPAAAHEEREATFPDGDGAVPRFLGFDNPRKRVVCRPDSRQRINRMPAGALKRRNQALLRQCRFGSIQDAINSISKRRTSVYVLPGVYHETKWADRKRSEYCSNLETASDDPLDAASYIGSITDPLTGQANAESDPIALSYSDQRRCAHNLNLIAIFGDSTPKNGSIDCDSRFCGTQVVGTGRRMRDVLLDNRFTKLNALRADRMSGFYLRNLTVQQAEFNSIYILESDGFVVDRVIARANDEYGILAFASDHGVIKNSDTYFNGDSGIYPGSASDVNGANKNFTPTRYSIVIKNNKSHHNTLGYSGTAGNSVYAHDNEFAYNATGIATDSLFPGHPGLPQDHARWSRNRIHSNNINYFEKYVDTGVCAKPMEERGYMQGAVCPVIPTPVGTGVLIAGGNYNSTDGNWIYNNWRYGTMQFLVPAALRDEYDPLKQTDTSHHNHTVGNKMGIRPDGGIAHNGQDHWWDDQGMGNCWEKNTYSRGHRTDNFLLDPPSCADGGSINPIGFPVKDADFLSCSQYDRNDPVLRHPPACSWFDSPTRPTAERAALLTDGEREVLRLSAARDNGSPEGGLWHSTVGLGAIAVLLMAGRLRRRRAS